MMTEAYAPQLVEIAGPTSRTLLRRRILGHKGLLIGTGLLIFILAMAVLAPVLAPYDPYAQDLANLLVTLDPTKETA